MNLQIIFELNLYCKLDYDNFDDNSILLGKDQVPLRRQIYCLNRHFASCYKSVDLIESEA